MTRTLGFLVVVASALVGCVSVNAPTVAPTATLSLGITTPAPATPRVTASPSATPTLAPTATPTNEPTDTPTDTPTEEPTDSPTAEVSPDPALGDLILFDDMEDPTSGWATGEQGGVSASYEDGVLRLAVGTSGQAVWSGRLFQGVEYGVVLAAAAFTPATEGGVGLLCSTPENELYGAEIIADGRLIFFSIIGGATQVLDTHEDLAIEMPANETAGFGLECAGTSTGNFRLAAVLNGGGVLGTYENVEGPETFNGFAVYGEATADAYTVDVEEAAAYAILGSEGSMSAEGFELIDHVPTDWRETCIETPSTDDAEAVISCFLQTDGTGAELAVFQQYATADAMNANYQDVVTDFGVDSEGSCQTGPHETTWTFQEEVGGRLQCAPQAVGIRFDWTDDELLIHSSLFDLEGDYQNTYDLWTEAGPI